MPLPAVDFVRCIRPECRQLFGRNRYQKHHKVQHCTKACASVTRSAHHDTAHWKALAARSAAVRRAKREAALDAELAPLTKREAYQLAYRRGYEACGSKKRGERTTRP